MTLCETCEGTGWVEVGLVSVPCPDCDGDGLSPDWWDYDDEPDPLDDDETSEGE